MVVFVDFESEDDDPYSHAISNFSHETLSHVRRFSQPLTHNPREQVESDQHHNDSSGSNGKLFASALACYPVSLSIAAHLDLNDLYQLSFTCRKIHDGLSQFARQLRTQSLHCVNDAPPRTSEEEVDDTVFAEALANIAESESQDQGVLAFSTSINSDADSLHINTTSALGLKGKVSQCARDLVAPCRKCGIIVCRNCAAKAPSDRCLPNRYRRICRTCLDAPFIDHLHPLSEDYDLHESPPTSSASSVRSVRTLSSSGSLHVQGREGNMATPSFTSPAFLREPCNCTSRGVYLCQPCGSGLIAADTTYKRVWTWRSRYSTHIGGGLGTGLGLGNQGQKCGRGEHCLERGIAGVCWVEIECSEPRAPHHGREGVTTSMSRTSLASEHDGENIVMNRPGYLSQELEGIGGVLKKKVKKRVKVGATVYEYDDERETGKYLVRESSGKQRSWCGWCSRVCPGEKDKSVIDKFVHQHP